jgi:signal transduction histidine kinase
MGAVNLGMGATSFAYFLFGSAGLSLLGLGLSRRGWYRPAASLLALLFISAIVFTIIDGDGLADPGVSALPIFILVVSFFFGKKAVVPSTVVSLAVVVGIYLGHQLGWLTLANAPGRNRVAVLVVLFVLMGVLAHVVLDTFERGLSRLKASERRNRLLSRELHDSVTQTLYSVRLTLEAARRALGQDPARLARLLGQVDGLVVNALSEMRSLLRQARPEALEQQGLAAALADHVTGLHDRGELEVEYEVAGDRELSVEQELAFYRAAQEALSNVSKHARVRQARLRVDLSADPLVLEVEDRGAGFEAANPAARSRGLGMTSMEERALALGGRLTVTSALGQGTRLRFEIPATAGGQNHG